MVSPKIQWNRLWGKLWKLIPEPETNGRLLVALDDFINPKTGRKIFGCANIFDHAAKQNQSKYPWAQNVVSIGLLKIIKGRWACLPLSHCYYHLKKDIEACFKELNRDIGSAETQTRNAVAVINHLEFCMMATTLTWVYACRLEKTPNRRHAVKDRNHFAFSDVRRLMAKAVMNDDFSILCPVPRNSVINSFVTTLLRMAA